jgi:hypothetical protein
MPDNRHGFAVLLGLVLIFYSCGCVPHREALQKGLMGARDVAAKAEPLFVASKRAEEQGCAEDAACLARVRADWARVADALDAMHAAWCALSPDSEGC